MALGSSSTPGTLVKEKGGRREKGWRGERDRDRHYWRNTTVLIWFSNNYSNQGRKLFSRGKSREHLLLQHPQRCVGEYKAVSLRLCYVPVPVWRLGPAQGMRERPGSQLWGLSEAASSLCRGT